MSKYTKFFIIGTLWLCILGSIVEPFANGFVLFIGFAIGVYSTLAVFNLWIDQQHGK